MDSILGALILLLPAFLFIVGLVLMFRGDKIKFRRGRCACGYSLRGLPNSVERCPECGAMRAMCRRTLWIRSDQVIVYGILCIIASLLLGPFAFTLAGLVLGW